MTKALPSEAGRYYWSFDVDSNITISTVKIKSKAGAIVWNSLYSYWQSVEDIGGYWAKVEDSQFEYSDDE